ncbi:30S ribosome-binding factor RbfA [Gleimia sp. 6138-11-ORH1]|uniref:30S ribosome-binding factor RbfA n=1 Tax=Gleimia sp. 6138-11-ORH1 TaxID=2973937 RepID=UPI0021693547|nr:30S ribosome-binding factor RbfA [Gleimia sp. 6138-11-ORH1]MCS4484218.1 30S ribosome-binding factor RbfA [Gleimia sp. 6138-11-ORH1]
MADQNRQRKVADRIQKTVAQLLEGRIKDPRLGFVTITDVNVTGDLQHATIFYTVYGKASDAERSAKALNSAKGMIRSEIGKALGIRLTPSIEFVADALPQSAARLEDALARAQATDQKVAALAEKAQYAGDADPYKHEVSVETSEETSAETETE